MTPAPAPPKAREPLLACPWCSTQPTVQESYDGPPGAEWVASCLNDECPVEPWAGYFGTEAQAIAAWNRRITRPSPAAGEASEVADRLEALTREWRGDASDEGVNLFYRAAMTRCATALDYQLPTILASLRLATATRNEGWREGVEAKITDLCLEWVQGETPAHLLMNRLLDVMEMHEKICALPLPPAKEPT